MTVARESAFTRVFDALWSDASCGAVSSDGTTARDYAPAPSGYEASKFIILFSVLRACLNRLPAPLALAI